MDKVVTEIIDDIKNNNYIDYDFNLSTKYDEHDDEYWILIDDSDIYHSEKYMKLVWKWKEKLWDIGIYNIFFAVEYGNKDE